MQSQIVSRQRVADHGEVLTGSREINAMLDLLKQETERIDSRFLEPACGNGNFLAEILDRKLAVVEKRYRKSQLEYERMPYWQYRRSTVSIFWQITSSSAGSGYLGSLNPTISACSRSGPKPSARTRFASFWGSTSSGAMP
jgi:hypothetical protein